MREVLIASFLAVFVGIFFVSVSAKGPMVDKGFCLEKGYGYYIPHGSKIHYKDGMTIVYGPDRKVMLKLKDSEVPKVPVPAGGLVPATHVIEVPSGSAIRHEGDGVMVYKDGKVILKVVNVQKKNP